MKRARFLVCVAAIVAATATSGFTLPPGQSEDVGNPQSWPKSFESTHFSYRYADTGEQKTSLEAVKQVARAMEESYNRLIVKGGLPAPAEAPYPVVVSSFKPKSELGFMEPQDGVKQYIMIDALAERYGSTLEEITAHELFHAIQWTMLERDPRDTEDWVIEGTAVAASFLAYADTPKVRNSMLKGDLREYLWSHSTNLVRGSYEDGLFWYDLARLYGGLTYLHRLFTYGTDFTFRRAAQLAAIAGGAPADTTFDSLYRQFALDLATEAIGLNFPEDRSYRSIWPDQSVLWTAADALPTDWTTYQWFGKQQTLAYSTAEKGGLDWDRHVYSYRQRLRLDPYSMDYWTLSREKAPTPEPAPAVEPESARNPAPKAPPPPPVNPFHLFNLTGSPIGLNPVRLKPAAPKTAKPGSAAVPGRTKQPGSMVVPAARASENRLKLTFNAEKDMMLYVFGTHPDDTQQVVRLSAGDTAILQLPHGATLHLGVIRYSSWGSGDYSLTLAPTEGSAAETPSVTAASIASETMDATGPGSPPPLDAATLAALRAGRLDQTTGNQP